MIYLGSVKQALFDVRNVGWEWIRFLTDYLAIKRILISKISLIEPKYKDEHAGISSKKYLDINYWLYENMRRIVALGLHKKKRKKLRILDIGTGTGYFPFICKYYGHEAEALDIPDNEMYNEIIRALNIKRYERYIYPFQAIAIERRYDLITAYMICFNAHKRPNLWHIREWEYFINSLYNNNLNPGGEVFLSFNVETPDEPISRKLLDHFSANNARIKGNTVYIKSDYKFNAERLNDPLPILWTVEGLSEGGSKACLL